MMVLHFDFLLHFDLFLEVHSPEFQSTLVYVSLAGIRPESFLSVVGCSLFLCPRPIRPGSVFVLRYVFLPFCALWDSGFYSGSGFPRTSAFLLGAWDRFSPMCRGLLPWVLSDLPWRSVCFGFLGDFPFPYDPNSSWPFFLIASVRGSSLCSPLRGLPFAGFPDIFQVAIGLSSLIPKFLSSTPVAPRYLQQCRGVLAIFFIAMPRGSDYWVSVLDSAT